MAVAINAKAKAPAGFAPHLEERRSVEREVESKNGPLTDHQKIMPAVMKTLCLSR